MYSDWKAAADAYIAKLMKDLPASATWQERQRLLRSHAMDFHCGTSWGKKVWGRRCKVYLALQGKPQTVTAKAAPLFAPDIIFPFRNAE